MPASIVKHIHKPCKSLFVLYGGTSKDQRKNYVKIPVGTAGTVTYLLSDWEDAIEFYLVKFNIDETILWCRCATYMVEVAS